MGRRHCFLITCMPRLSLEDNLDVWESCLGGKAWPVCVQGPKAMRKDRCCTPPAVELARINVLEDLACLDDLAKHG